LINMRFRYPFFAVLFSLAAAAWGQTGATDTTITADYVVALINSEPITDSDLRMQTRIMEQQLREQGRNGVSPTAVREAALERLITERIQLQMAAQMGIRAEEAAVDQAEKTVAAQNQLSVANLRQNLEKEGLSTAVFRRQLGDQVVLGRLREREVDARVKISEPDVDTAVAAQEAANAQLTNQNINIAQLLIALPENPSAAQLAAAQAKAQSALKRIRNGEAFEALVSELSEGDRRNGGQLGVRRADRYPDLFAAAIHDLSVGGVSEPVRSGAGLHILKLIDRQTVRKAATLSQTRARHILLTLNPELNAAQAQERLQNLRESIVSRNTSFEEAARSNSQDGSAAQGGDLGWANPGMFVPEFEQVMDRLREGDISAPILSRFGVHLIQVLERRRVELSPEQQREQLRQQLRAQKIEERYTTWLAELRARAFIEIREP
jgi:peptidyl-prolyl cis-trans isomerase SurA